MPSFLLALFASMFFGASDFVAGWSARRNSTLLTLVVSQTTSVAGLIVLCLVLGGHPARSDFQWAMTAGCGLAGGLGFLYWGLSRAHMSEVAPIASVCAISLPVLVDPVHLGLITYGGIGLAILAVILIGRSERQNGAMPRKILPLALGAIAGSAFGSFYICLQHCHPTAGFWPLLTAQVTSFTLAGLFTVLTLVRGVKLFSQTAQWPLGLLPGCLVVAGNICLLLALQGTASLSIVVTLVALYPVTTVLLALLVLHEKLRPVQGVGLAAAAGAIILIAGFAKPH